MQYSEDDNEENPKDINNIINKYESNLMIFKKDNSEITSQNSKRTKNTSNFSVSNKYRNDNIKILEEDFNKNISSSIQNKSIKTNNSKKVSQNDIEINIENNNINNIIPKKISDNHINSNKNIKNKFILISLENNYKTEKNNTSVYDTSYNMLFNNPYENNKISFNNNRNITLLKEKSDINIMNKIAKIEENKLIKQNNELISKKIKKNKLKVNDKDNFIKNKYKKYFNKLFKRKTKNNNIVYNNINVINSKKIIYTIDKNKKGCKCNLLNTIRNILVFLIISGTLTFYISIFFINK